MLKDVVFVSKNPQKNRFCPESIGYILKLKLQQKNIVKGKWNSCIKFADIWEYACQRLTSKKCNGRRRFEKFAVLLMSTEM